MRRNAWVFLVLLCVLLYWTLGRSGPIVPNQSRIVGVVVMYTILDSDLVGVVPHQTLYELAILVESSEGVAPYPDLLAGSAGSVVEVLSKVELDPCLYGKLVQIEIRRAGDEVSQSTWLLPGTLVVLGSDLSIQTPSFCIE